MLLVDREILEMRFAAIGKPDGVDARGLADSLMPYFGRRAQRVVAADDIVVMDDVIRMPAWRSGSPPCGSARRSLRTRARARS